MIDGSKGPEECPASTVIHFKHRFPSRRVILITWKRPLLQEIAQISLTVAAFKLLPQLLIFTTALRMTCNPPKVAEWSRLSWVLLCGRVE